MDDSPIERRLCAASFPGSASGLAEGDQIGQVPLFDIVNGRKLLVFWGAAHNGPWGCRARSLEVPRPLQPRPPRAHALQRHD
jgi:hypothetical protein